MSIFQLEPIAALATAPGIGAIAVIRVSGEGAIAVTNRIFRGKDLTQQASHTAHFGTLRNPDGSIIDEVLVTIFRTPTSFTKEDVIEISCHGSEFIIQQILRRLTQEGIRLARPGEFTQRAFLNGQFDLVQAEAVADLIASDSDASHRAALTQLRGGFSKQLKELRQQLIDFVALVELELDFGEEDVEFAHRDRLRQLMVDIRRVLHPLIDSFSTGNAIKNGVPTVIVGKPNAGKSTLLNALLNEEKAIVSDIPGTTRDVIEDELFINGIRFRLIDTAGLRQATDQIEAIGIERTQQKMRDAALVLYLFDGSRTTTDELIQTRTELQAAEKPYLLVGNKADLLTDAQRAAINHSLDGEPIVWISAKDHRIDELKASLSTRARTDAAMQTGSAVVTNARHYEHLTATDDALARAITGLDNQVTPDWLAMDLRVALQHLGQLTGEITTDDLLDSIFSKFCIGK
ncbi:MULTISPECIES: tRNA uridine-5-carboxymethylaminomethyl(34) synthesis GTPase MnmE [unclassified Spirosoma]|uniref:tRNA uridine-5-carboxymethylaminomethyl(34) synthesis GTPase MnmE n=1 Tax=unclassified Spirosoma TaxID=2621999 RepID=UPI00096494D9|nr:MULTISPECIES: tRNA uridine-5-carboxymethylaminomethyl(34) synthesis GTPase MnmE [unclassified Spirosoma]MBN8824875.1 tRNA uridine-5-carboxymethylaminomethyl(34) synthesis GTPase MnmE [Spirosoma sp.]OJW74799.1 MAG: tRNA uridine-5-carboxymethylaminomethyl(34) synthesis GTPase MnmE [Spirosoma sp. 48-14]